MEDDATDRDEIDEELVDAASELATDQLAKGGLADETRAPLVANGLDEAGADLVLDDVRTTRTERLERRARRHMLVGGLWFAGGTVGMVVAHSAAVGTSFRADVGAWVAMLVGLILFLFGAAQMWSADRSPPPDDSPSPWSDDEA